LLPAHTDEASLRVQIYLGQSHRLSSQQTGLLDRWFNYDQPIKVMFELTNVEINVLLFVSAFLAAALIIFCLHILYTVHLCVLCMHVHMCIRAMLPIPQEIYVQFQVCTPYISRARPFFCIKVESAAQEKNKVLGFSLSHTVCLSTFACGYGRFAARIHAPCVADTYLESASMGFSLFCASAVVSLMKACKECLT
jgi:hypothetical protein